MALFDQIDGSIDVAVRAGGTITVPYPVGRVASDYAETGATLSIRDFGTIYEQDAAEFSIVYGGSSAVLTLITVPAIPIRTEIVTGLPLAVAASGDIAFTPAGEAMATAASASAQTALLTAFSGDGGAGGAKGLVPAPAAGDTAAGKYLKADGTWAVPPTGGGGGGGDVTLTGVQTLTNKTLTAPVLNSPTGLVKADVGLGSVDNTADSAKPVSTAQATADGLRVLKAGDTMTGALVLPADPTLPLQAATKQYVDAIIASQDAMVFKGIVDCSSNPNYPAADRGWTYRVSVAGKIGGASGTNVEAGDILLCLTDSTASGNQATVGTAWGVIQTNIDGAVTLTGTQTLTNKTLTAPAITSPTGIVKADVGLGNVDNTSDATKNSASATLTNKTLTAPVINSPTGLAKADVGLSGLTLASTFTTSGVFSLTLTATAATNVTLPTSGTLATTAQIPVKAAGSDIRTGTDDAKFATAKSLVDAAAYITLTDAATVAWDLSTGFNAKVTIAGNRTFGAPTNPKEGLTYTLRVIQDGTGSRTGTWNACFDWGTTGTPTLSTTAAKDDLITLICVDASTPKFRAFFNKAA